MKRIDITRELLSAPVYPGDPPSSLEAVSRIEWGDSCNLSAMHGCLHAGTHLDAPLHFIPDVEDVASIPLEACVGECTVVPFEGLLLGEQAEKLLARLQHPRLLFKGEMALSPSAAFVLSDAGLSLLGVEGASVSPPECTTAVHRQLLGGGVVLLEGLDLSSVEPGDYFLFAPPLKIAGGDGSPVRAVLIQKGK